MKILTNDNYYEEDEYFSVSSWKKYNTCEVNAKLGVYNGLPTTALLVGQYVDSYIEGTLDKFISEHPEIISSRGETKGQLKSDYKQAEEICRFMDNDKRIQQFLSGDKQTIMSGKISNVPFKIKMDAYSKGIAINDLKCLRTVTNSKGEFYDFVTQWDYDIQLACYQEIVYQNTGEKLPTYLVVVTKESPINSVIVNIPQDYLDRALYCVESTIEHFYDVKLGKVDPVGCGTCHTCIENRTETPIISLYDIIQNNS